jgi:hypothetical protein
MPMDDAKSRTPAMIKRAATSIRSRSPVTPIGVISIILENGKKAITISMTKSAPPIFSDLTTMAVYVSNYTNTLKPRLSNNKVTSRGGVPVGSHHRIVKDRRRRDKQGSLRAYSFLATLIIIGVLIGASYIASLPQVEHIPDNFVFDRQAWMQYVPKSAEYALYVDFANADSISGSTEIFGTQPLLELYQLNVSIFPQDAAFEVDMQLSTSQFNATATLIKLLSLKDIQTALESYTKAPSSSYQGYTLHTLLMRKAGDQKLQQGFLSLAEGYLIASDDQAAGRQSVERILDQFAFNAPSLFDDPSVRRGVYAAGITDQQYIGLAVGTFQTQLNDSRMTVKSVLKDQNGILVTRSILFPSSDTALSRFGEAHRVYRDASSYRILDSWLVVSYTYPIDKLRGELTGI